MIELAAALTIDKSAKNGRRCTTATPPDDILALQVFFHILPAIEFCCFWFWRGRVWLFLMHFFFEKRRTKKKRACLRRRIDAVKL